MLSPTHPPATLRTVTLTCTRCARPFPYHYKEPHILQHLLPIDRVCMRCLTDFVNDTVSESVPSVPAKGVAFR